MIINKPLQNKNNYVVAVTVIFDNYDILHKQPKNDNIEYICITDNPNIYNPDNCYNIIVDEYLKNTNWDGRKKTYYTRYNLNKYNFNSNNILWIDATIQLTDSFIDFLNNKIINYNFWGVTYSNLNKYLFNDWIKTQEFSNKSSEFYDDFLIASYYCRNINLDKTPCIISTIKYINLRDNNLVKILNNTFDDLIWNNLVHKIIVFDEPIFSYNLCKNYNNYYISKWDRTLRNDNKTEIELNWYKHNSNKLRCKICLS